MEARDAEPDRRSPGAVRIETDRLILRTHAPGDAEAVFQGLNHWDVASMLSRLPWPYTLSDAEAYIARVQTRDARRDQPMAIIHRRHGLIGGIGLHTEDGVNFPELGYWIAPEHWGAGYASEAAAAALPWAATEWRRRAIRAGHFVENPASGRVLSKAGMLYTGVVEPQMCLARGEAVATRKMVWLA